MKHRHAEMIKAWADGETIEFLSIGGTIWKPVFKGWNWDNELVSVYRIRPDPKPDYVRYLVAEKNTNRWEEVNKSQMFHLLLNCKVEAPVSIELTYDGETGKLKSTKVYS